MKNENDFVHGRWWAERSHYYTCPICGEEFDPLEIADVDGRSVPGSYIDEEMCEECGAIIEVEVEVPDPEYDIRCRIYVPRCCKSIERYEQLYNEESDIATPDGMQKMINEMERQDIIDSKQVKIFDSLY